MGNFFESAEVICDVGDDGWRKAVRGDHFINLRTEQNGMDLFSHDHTLNRKNDNYFMKRKATRKTIEETIGACIISYLLPP